MAAPGDVVAQSKHFRVAEADAGVEPLVERTVSPWYEATPDGFLVDVRAHRLLTQHAAPAESIWPEVRDLMSSELRSRPRVYASDLPGRALDVALDRFLAAVRPIHEHGRLGVLLFPFGSYFVPSPRTLDYLAWLRGRSGDLPIAVELRNRQWVDSRHREETLRFFEEHRLSYVCVDAPSGFESSLPPLAVVTASPAVVRFHGRDADAWERGADTGDDRFASSYRRSDLEPWRSRIDKLTSGGRAVHVLFTTGTADAAARDARLLVRVLAEEPAPAPPEPAPARGRRPPHRR